MTATVTPMTLQDRLRHIAEFALNVKYRYALNEAADRIDELESQLGRWVELATYQKGELLKAKQLIGGGE